jgi:hypothetical protein
MLKGEMRIIFLNCITRFVQSKKFPLSLSYTHTCTHAGFIHANTFRLHLSSVTVE